METPWFSAYGEPICSTIRIEMRVIAGKFRNRSLKTGAHFRPTTDRVRETLFNILQNEIEGAVFVDAFAGSGAVGIEALSRGAAFAYFLEKNRRVLQILETNLTQCGEDAKWRILSIDAMKGLEVVEKSEPAANILFFDPPYDFPQTSKLLEHAASLFPEAMFILETSTRTKLPLPPNVNLVKDRGIGETLLSFYWRARRP